MQHHSFIIIKQFSILSYHHQCVHRHDPKLKSHKQIGSLVGLKQALSSLTRRLDLPTLGAKGNGEIYRIEHQALPTIFASNIAYKTCINIGWACMTRACTSSRRLRPCTGTTLHQRCPCDWSPQMVADAVDINVSTMVIGGLV